MVEFTRDHLERIVDIADDAIVCVDEAQRIILFNKGAERIFGYTAQETLGRPLEMLLPAAARGGHAAHLGGFGASGVAARRMGERTAIAGLRRDGTEFPAEASISCLDSERGRLYTAILRDVSSQHRQAEMLRAAKQAAEAATHAKAMFLANMSHEIRTPLNAIIGMSSLLQQGALSDEQGDFVQTLQASGEALLAIVNDILDYTRIEVGGLALDVAPFDPRAAVEASLDLVAGQAAQKGIELACLVDDAVPAMVSGDGARLRQVLLNLLANAVKFTRRGEVVASLESAPAGGDAIELHFAVADSGIGIAAVDLDKLFQPFSQVDASTTREFGGTGLGLAISWRLCELMGGRMWVDSAVGQGSTFHFTAVVRAAPPQAVPRVHAAQPLLAGRRLLVVDDNTTNRRVLVNHALRWGMVPQAVASPQEALDLVRHGHPVDVAILDMNMPGMDGLALGEALRALRDARSLPLVLLSSLGQRPASAAGPFEGHLHKPVKAAQLLDVLTACIARAAGLAPAALPSEAAAQPRVLVAEDNAVNRRVALHMLAHLGIAADVAADGEAVLDALERRDYDIVLMDLQMPGMDGIEATRRIDARRGRPRPRIIAMTASALQGDRVRCLEAGMDGYLGKPLDLASLEEAIRRHARPGTSVAAGHACDALDEARLFALLRLPGGTELLREVKARFLAEIPAGAQALARHAANGDAAALSRLAHRLASTALACGARHVAETCRELQDAGERGAIWLCEPRLRELEARFDRARAALEALGEA